MTSAYENFDNKTFSDLVFNNDKSYWLSSRDINCDANVANFDIRVINVGEMYGRYMLNSTNVNYGGNYNFRPVVTLNANIIIAGGEGTETNPYKIYA